MPKLRWFKRFFKFLKNVTPVNLSALQRDPRVVDGMEISPLWLRQSWYADWQSQIKVLGDGLFTKNVVFIGIDAFSKSALEKIHATKSTIA
jgi:ribosomal protein L15